MTKFNLPRIRTSLRIRIVIGFTTVLLIALMFPKGESLEAEVTEGMVWIKDDLIAPFSFPILKDEEIYKAEVRASVQSVYPVFFRDDNAVALQTDSLLNYNKYLLTVIDNSLADNDESEINPTFLSAASFRKFKHLRSQEKHFLVTANKTMTKIFSFLERVIHDINDIGIYNNKTELPVSDSIAIRTGNIDRVEPLANFLALDDARELLKRRIKKQGYAEDIESAVFEYAQHFLQPNMIYNLIATAEEVEQARKNVSRYTGIVNENERIIAKHERVTKDAKLKIDSYKIAKGERIGAEGYLLQFVGKFFHIAFLVALFSIYIFLFRKKVFYDNQRIILISLVFVFLSFVTYLLNQISVNAPIHLLIFLPAASMLLTIIFDSRVGFYSTVILALILGALRGNDYTFTAMNLFAGGLSVYTVRDIKNRSQIFRSFLFILLGYGVSVIAFGLERFASADTILVELAFAGSNSLISPVFTYGLLIFFERFFKITTDLTLLELSNFDRPLLRDLARKAPGTFNHSMTIGTLAETAAEKINANPLLARVGSYYHDIGKSLYPQNFVENQLNNQNIHENLPPEESSKLISEHVKEGIELAKQYKLPQEVIDFIPMHHGTTLMSFFYEKAKRLYGETKVDENDYRYPGPKPNSKETAIVMLADGCESAVRSIQEPDTSKVENVIDTIVNSRINDHQLDDSPLTFADITKVKEAFKSILLGQHHKRIRYPNQDEMEQGGGKEEEK